MQRLIPNLSKFLSDFFGGGFYVIRNGGSVLICGEVLTIERREVRHEESRGRELHIELSWLAIKRFNQPWQCYTDSPEPDLPEAYGTSWSFTNTSKYKLWGIDVSKNHIILFSPLDDMVGFIVLSGKPNPLNEDLKEDVFEPLSEIKKLLNI